MSVAASRRRMHGFTLVELLIALAMLGLIALLLFSGLRLGSRSWESVERVAAQSDALRFAHGFLMRALSQIRSVETAVDAGNMLVFEGDAEHLEFVAPLSDYLGLPGLYVLRLGLENRGAGKALILTRWLLHPEILAGGKGVPAWEPLTSEGSRSFEDLATEMDTAGGAFGRTLLIANVDAFAVAYFGLADGEDEPGWHTDWFGQTKLPTLVRIRLTTTTQTWPELVVALPAQTK